MEDKIKLFIFPETNVYLEVKGAKPLLSGDFSNPGIIYNFLRICSLHDMTNLLL